MENKLGLLSKIGVLNLRLCSEVCYKIYKHKLGAGRTGTSWY